MLGIGITTCNRFDLLTQALDYLARHTPPDAHVVVVDDGSKTPVIGAGVRNDKPKGIAAAKNQCLDVLMSNPEVTDIFLFDDDCFPTGDYWWKPYVDSEHDHLSYMFQPEWDTNCEVIYDDGHLFAQSTGQGCMQYFTRRCIEVVGGLRTEFGRWSYEHLEHSQRIYNSGLSYFPFQGLHTSSIFALDEYEEGQSSVPQTVRRQHLRRNKALFETYKDSVGFVEYRSEVETPA